MPAPHRISLAAIATVLTLTSTVSADTTADRVRTLEQTVSTLQQRVTALEAQNAKLAAAIELLQNGIGEGANPRAGYEAREPDPTAMWAVNIDADLAANQYLGDVNAPVTVVWAWDAADPYSARSIEAFDHLLAAYRGKVRVVLKHLIVHPRVAEPAHLAECAAAKQRKTAVFWKAYWKHGYDAYETNHDAKSLSAASVRAVAKGAGLDMKAYDTDVASPACHQQIDDDRAELARFQAAATPTFWFNGTLVVGAQGEERFRAAIDAALATSSASGVAPARYYADVVMRTGEHKFRSKLTPKP